MYFVRFDKWNMQRYALQCTVYVSCLQLTLCKRVNNKTALLYYSVHILFSSQWQRKSSIIFFISDVHFNSNQTCDLNIILIYLVLFSLPLRFYVHILYFIKLYHAINVNCSDWIGNWTPFILKKFYTYMAFINNVNYTLLVLITGLLPLEKNVILVHVHSCTRIIFFSGGSKLLWSY